jgi:acyl-CoA hydrolase
MVETTARVVYVGRTSCMVKVTVFAEDLDSSNQVFCCEGYFTMVGLGTTGKPESLPLIPVNTDEQRAEWEIAEVIKQAMLKRREQARGRI